MSAAPSLNTIPAIGGRKVGHSLQAMIAGGIIVLPELTEMTV